MASRITIIGGGYAGIMMARGLDNMADVTLIEPRDKWVHNVAMIRALAVPDLLDQVVMPYDRLLQNGRVLRDRAVGIEGLTVQLASGEAVAGDMVIVATGSSYASPFKMRSDDSETFLKQARRVISQIDRATHIAIVGGGAVGCELAGEIASARPEKQVTLVDADERLFPGYPPRLGRSLTRQLGELGVKLRLGESVKKLKQTDAPYVPAGKKLLLADGFPIAADLVIPAIGTRPQTSLIETVNGVQLDDRGRVTVDPWLRPTTEPELFVLGDIAGTSDSKTIVGLTRQAEWLIRAVGQRLSGKEWHDIRRYRPWRNPYILIPLGPDKGASALPFCVTGPLLTSAIKGRRLFLPRYHRQFDWTPQAG